MSDTYNSGCTHPGNFARKSAMKIAFVYLSLVIAGGILLTNLYTSIVDAKSWGADIPDSIDTARQYYKTTNPGDFFRVFSPLNQLLALVAMIAFWNRGKRVRTMLIVALALYVVAEGMTFGYFYPRNAIMFEKPIDVAAVKTAWQEWDSMNWVRSLLIAAGIACTAMGLHRIYSTARPA
jgi:hypothetical protein